jgi:hypothetical protein
MRVREEPDKVGAVLGVLKMASGGIRNEENDLIGKNSRKINSDDSR